MQTTQERRTDAASLKRLQHNEECDRQTTRPSHTSDSGDLVILASSDDKVRILRLLQSEVHGGLFFIDSGKERFQLCPGKFPRSIVVVSWHPHRLASVAHAHLWIVARCRVPWPR